MKNYEEGQVIRKNVTPILKDLGDGVIEAVIASDSIDRSGERIEIDGLDIRHYKNHNPIVAWAHNYDEPSIAQTTKIWKSAGKVIARMKFAIEEYDFAHLIYKLYKGGYMRMFSIGFIPKDVEEDKNGTFVFKESEMVEYSAVLIGSNRDALMRAKSIGLNIDAFDKVCKGDMCIEDKFNVEIKPYPNEHACRLQDPGKYDKFARKNCYRKSDGKCIDYIFGIKDGKSELQSMRYPKEEWGAADAKAHCKEAEGTFEPASEKKEIYECECLDCGHKFKTEEHCKDVKCPKCGGKTRRAERPGPGKIIPLSEFEQFKAKINKSLELTEKAYKGLRDQLNKLNKKQKVVRVYLVKAKRLAQFADKSNEITIKTIKKKLGKE